MKKRIGRWLLAGAVALPLAALVGPFLIPVPPLEGVMPARELADPDSQFVNINDLDVHLKTSGNGEPVFVLLHGFGASLYSWQAVMQPFGELGSVIAYDRPAFGLTERPLSWKGENPYSSQAQVSLLIGLLDHFNVQQAVLVGSSAGGETAIQTALQHPERVSALILVDAAVYTRGGVSSWIRPLLATPQMRRVGPLFTRRILNSGTDILNTAWHDPSRITPEWKALYQKPLQVENWDKALWEFTTAARHPDLTGSLGSLDLPVLVVTGDDDRIIPTTESIRLAGEIPGADLSVIQNAGHLPHEEQPAVFMDAVRRFLSSLEN